MDIDKFHMFLYFGFHRRILLPLAEIQVFCHVMSRRVEWYMVIDVSGVRNASIFMSRTLKRNNYRSTWL